MTMETQIDTSAQRGTIDEKGIGEESLAPGARPGAPVVDGHAPVRVLDRRDPDLLGGGLRGGAGTVEGSGERPVAVATVQLVDRAPAGREDGGDG